jgi:hypothetical protein
MPKALYVFQQTQISYNPRFSVTYSDDVIGNSNPGHYSKENNF